MKRTRVDPWHPADLVPAGVFQLLLVIEKLRGNIQSTWALVLFPTVALLVMLWLWSARINEQRSDKETE